MHITGLLFVFFSTFFFSGGSLPASKSTLTFEEAEKYVQKINLLKSKKQLTKFEHKDMTAWGSLTGYWDKNGLVMLHALYNAEKGFKEISVYYYKDEICRIACNDHLANWKAYEKDHGDEVFDISKLTYTDNQYDFTSGTELIYRVLDGDKFVIAKTSTELYEKLSASAGEMKQFIEEAANN